jgi:putative membrane protein
MPALEGAMAGIYGDQYLVQMGLLAAILAPSLVLGLVLRRPVIRLNDWVLAKLDETKFL